MKDRVLLIGTGPMSLAYAKVLSSLDIEFSVVGRGLESRINFESQTGVKPVGGGLKHYLETVGNLDGLSVIIATGTESLMEALLLAVSAGASKILVEKPAAISIDELLTQETFFAGLDTPIFLAYNRRFYASVVQAQQLIQEDGGLQSIQFEFTEWVHVIEGLKKPPGVKENLFFANSTHVIDLAFFLAGKPREWACYSTEGDLKWHKKTNFAGAGLTENGVLFSYLSNWSSAGRWSIELFTGKRRIYLKPLEALFIQKKGSVALEPHTFDDSFDTTFKPGIYLQTKAFVEGNFERLPRLNDHILLTRKVYSKMLNHNGSV
jgi:predicted dehydrogenase